MTSTAKIIPIRDAPSVLQAAMIETHHSRALMIPVNPTNKRPYLTKWQVRGSRDQAQLCAWWARWPDAMLGVLTGERSNLWALDIDDKKGGEGSASLAQLEATYGKLPATPAHRTPGGRRLWFKWPKGLTLKSRAGDMSPGLDVRGGTACGKSKGQAVIPPSVRADGKSYAWEEPWVTLADAKPAPTWLLFFAIFGKRDREKLAALGIDHTHFAEVPFEQWRPMALAKLRPKASHSGEPAHDLNAEDITNVERYLRKAITSECETLAKVEEGRRNIECNNTALRIHSLLKGGEEIGFDTAALEEWAFAEFWPTANALIPDAERSDFAEDQWLRTEGVAEPRDLQHLVTREVAQPITGAGTGEPTPYLAWPDADDKGKPHQNSARNVMALVGHLGSALRSNEFTGCFEIQKGTGEFVEMNDSALNALWSKAQDSGLPIKVDSLHRLVSVVANQNPHHPVRAYLEGLQWDGKPRVDEWLSRVLGAEDTPLNRAFGRVTLLGAVWRIIEPGCKFDYLLTLEGPQGSLKSSAVAGLGGPFFGDGLRIGLGAKETIEQTRGLWIIEIAELAGMQSREVEMIKDHVSRQTDRARMAFGRFASVVPRQWIAIATTNSDEYLRDVTGNRRFLPVRVGTIDLEMLRKNRDQLWAEAYAIAKGGERPVLPKDLWAAAGEAQEERRVVSSIEERLQDILEGVTGIVGKEDLWRALGKPDPAHRTPADETAFKAALKKLGWRPDRRRRPKAERERCYIKSGQDAGLEWLVLHDGRFMTEERRDLKLGPGSGFSSVDA